MTRSLLGFICLLALGVMPMVGCGETTGTAGSGGSGGGGGMAGSSGSGVGGIAAGGADGVVGCDDDMTAKARRSGLNAAASPDVPNG